MPTRSEPRPDVAALAEDLAAVLIDGRAATGRNHRVDTALAAALEALEAIGPADGVVPLDRAGVDAVVTLVVQLVVELRHGGLDRPTCRATAPLVLDRVARCFGAPDRLEPLLVLLSALSVLPDAPGGSELPRALDGRPDPDLPAEVALEAALADPARRRDLLDSLATATLFVPVLDVAVEGEAMSLRLLPLVLREGAVACVFTSQARWDEFVSAAGVPATPALELTGAELRDLWPAGHGLAVNPGSVLGTVVSERDVRAL